MTLKCVHFIINFVFYIILAAIIIHSLNHLMNAPTAFEEYEVEMDASLPSFTLCPFYDPDRDFGPGSAFDKVESFEQAMIAIERAKRNYTVFMMLGKPFKPQ